MLGSWLLPCAQLGGGILWRPDEVNRNIKINQRTWTYTLVDITTSSESYCAFNRCDQWARIVMSPKCCTPGISPTLIPNLGVSGQTRFSHAIRIDAITPRWDTGSELVSQFLNISESFSRQRSFLSVTHNPCSFRALASGRRGHVGLGSYLTPSLLHTMKRKSFSLQPCRFLHGCLVQQLLFLWEVSIRGICTVHIHIRSSTRSTRSMSA